MLFNELCILSTPFLLGKSIDGLIDNNCYWILLLGISYFLSNFFNYKRMVYDTKVYTTIYNDIVLNFLKKNDVDVSTKIARTDMAHEIVNVLENYLHYYIGIIVTIIGSLIFIYSENWQVGIFVSFAIVFITSAVFILYKKIKQGITIFNNNYEKKTKSIKSGYLSSEYFFNRSRKISICQSTIQGKNWFLVNGIKYVFLLLSIILLINTTKDITIGSVITVYSYVNNFLIALLSAPVAIEMFIRINDVLKRLN
jgi:ABC-type multidrug transport system fused ATPase/permease subunit